MVKTTIVSFKNGAIPLYYMVQMARDKMHALVYVQMSEVDRFMTRLNLSFESTLFYLDVEGERTLVFPRQLSCHPSSSFVVKVRYSYGAPESLNFIRMNFIKGTVVQIPIRYYNKDKNKEHHLLLFRLE